MSRSRAFVGIATGAAVMLSGLVMALPAGAADAIGAPANPTVGAVATAADTDGGDSIFRWEPVLGATGYQLEISTSSTFAAGTDVALVKTVLPSWVPTAALGGTDGQDLWWRVAAMSGTTVGTWSDAQDLWQDAMSAPVPLGPGSSPSDAEVQYPAAVTFSWQPVAGATSYDVRYAPSSDTDFSTSAAVTLKATTASSAGPTDTAATLTYKLLPRTVDGQTISWHWQVRAHFYTGAGTSSVGPWSTEDRTFSVTWPSTSTDPGSGTVPVLRLLEPAQSTGGASEPMVSDPLLRWTAVPGATAYRVVLGPSASSTTVTTVLLTTTVTTTSYVPNGTALIDGQYYWQVTPLDADGQAGTPSGVGSFVKRWGAQTSAGADTAFALAYPVPLVGSQNLASPDQVPLDRFQLSWLPLPRATYYEVEVSATDGSTTLTCQTASTSVTIFAAEAAASGSGAGNTKLLQQNGTSCLWSNQISKRILQDKTYRWKVRGVQLLASSTSSITGTAPTGSVVSAWSDPMSDTAPDRARYVQASAPTAGSASNVVLDGSSTTQGSAGEPAPLLSWQPVTGATFYTVQISTTEDPDQTVIATFRVPGTSLRATGVFQDVNVNLPYFWRVRAANSDITASDIVYTTNWSNNGTWTKTSTGSSFAGTTAVTSDKGTTVLRWTPQAVSAPNDGGSRGYLVTIKDASSNVVGTAQKVTYPFFVAGNISGTTVKSLTPGNYSFTVAPLDATGTAGTASEPRSFVVDGSAPTGLAATRSGSGEKLSWNASPGASSYKVTLTTGTTTRTLSPNASQTTVTFADVAPGAYTWTVTPVDYTGVTGTGASGAFTIDPGSVATRSTGTEPASGAVITWQNPALDWAPVAGASRYVVKITTSAGVAVETAETVATSYVPGKALAYGTQYQWQVVAVPELATTSSTRPILAQSSPVNFTFNGAPGTPAKPSAVVTNGTTVTATWAALTGSALGSPTLPGYVVRYGIVNPATGAPDEWLGDATPQNTLSYTLTGLQPGATYALQVRAENDLGTSAWSTQATATTGTAPGVPRNVTATPTGVGSLRLAWSAPSMTVGSPAVSGYIVTYGVGTTVPKVVTLTGTSTTITGLGRATYTITVAAQNALGTGPTATVAGVPYAAPSAPVSVKVVRGDRSAIVTWAKPASDGGSAINGYVVQTSAYSATTKTWGSWVTKANVGATTLKATVASLTNGSSYHVRVYAKSAAAPTGAPSATLTVVPAGKPLGPGSVAVKVSTGKAVITWKKANANGSAVTGYVLQYSTNNKTWSTKASPKATATSYTWSKPTKKKTYYVRIYAKNALGSGTPSASVKFVAK